jgi:hypothetical protein
MEKLFLIGMLLICSLTFGQDFKIGKESDLAREELIDEGIDSQGFIYDKDDNVVLRFETNRYYRIYLTISEKKDIVYKSEIVIEFDTWEELFTKYKTLKSEFTNSFGKPTKISEKFSGKYKLGDGNELEALENGFCIYITHFKDKDKTLYEISINKDSEYDEARILITAINEKYR